MASSIRCRFRGGMPLPSTTPRPRFSPEIARIAATEIVAELIKGGHLTEAEREQSVDDIAEHAKPYDDGYELAQRLDDYAGWDCDFMMSEMLNGFSWACSEAIAEAQKKWASETNQQPHLPIGTRVSFGDGERGEITGIYEHGAAQYLVKVDGDKDADGPHESRRIVNFEGVEAETESA